MAKKQAKTKKPSAKASDLDALAIFAGQTFCLAGRFTLYNAEQEIAKKAAARGGTLVSQIDAELSYLVVGKTGFATAQRAAEKLNKKQGASIQMIDESTFFAMASPTRDEAIMLLTSGKAGIELWQQLTEGNGTIWPDLSSADLRKLEIPEGTMLFRLDNLNLDGADLQGSQLVGSYLSNLRGVNLDGASLVDCFISGDYRGQHGFSQCTIRKANCQRVHWSGSLDQSDFSHSKLARAGFRACKGSQVVFSQTGFANADFAHADLVQPDFSGADLTDANFNRATLAGAKFNKANLRGAVFTSASLQNADLSGADLREANLSGADLTGAIVNGADFRGACLQRATIALADLDCAKGITAKSADVDSRIGPKLSELETVATAAQSVEMTVVFSNDRSETKIAFNSNRSVFLPKNQASYYRASWEFPTDDRDTRFERLIDSDSLATLMVSVGHQFRKDTFQFDGLEVKAKKSSVIGKALKQLALAAWCETLAIPLPDETAAAAQRQARAENQASVREELLKILRSGAKGVEQWNGLDETRRKNAGSFRGVDLAKAKLSRIVLRDLEFRNANLRNSNLTKAEIWRCDFREATFDAGRLDGAEAIGNQFSGASFADASLSSGF